MIIQVEKKIKELQELRSKEYYKRKDTDLENWGIAKEGKGKKATPIVITDEEYEKLIKTSNGVGKTGRNTVAIKLSKAATVAMVVCCVAAVVALITSVSKGFVWASLWVMAGLTFSLLFKGIAEAIRLLQQLLDGGNTSEIIKKEAPVIATAPVITTYAPVQPPIYQQYPAYPQYPQPTYYTPAAQPAAPVAPVAPVAAPAAPVAPAAPAEKKADDYKSIPAIDFNPNDDFFTKPYEPKATFGEN